MPSMASCWSRMSPASDPFAILFASDRSWVRIGWAPSVVGIGWAGECESFTAVVLSLGIRRRRQGVSLLATGDGEGRSTGLPDGCPAFFLADFQGRHGRRCRELPENVRREQRELFLLFSAGPGPLRQQSLPVGNRFVCGGLFHGEIDRPFLRRRTLMKAFGRHERRPSRKGGAVLPAGQDLHGREADSLIPVAEETDQFGTVAGGTEERQQSKHLSPHASVRMAQGFLHAVGEARVVPSGNERQ